MPSQAEMKAALQAYIDGFNADDADAIMALFADDAVIEDPVGSPLKSRAEFDAFIRQGGEVPRQAQARRADPWLVW